MPEQRKRLYCVAEISLSTTLLFEVPAIAERLLGPATPRGIPNVPRSRVGLPESAACRGGALPAEG